MHVPGAVRKQCNAQAPVSGNARNAAISLLVVRTCHTTPSGVTAERILKGLPVESPVEEESK